MGENYSEKRRPSLKVGNRSTALRFELECTGVTASRQVT